MDFMGYTKKKNDWTSRERQHLTRETPNFNGTTYLRLPEQRDYWASADKNPLDIYLTTKDYNDKFFKLSTPEKINLQKFNGHTNYLTAAHNPVGVSQFKQYYLDKNRRTTTDWLLPEGERSSSENKTHKNREKYLLMKKLLAQEKAATKTLNGKFEELAAKTMQDK